MKALLISKPFKIEPLGLMYLSSAAKTAGHDVELASTKDDLERKLAEFKPGVVGYSVITGDHNFYLELNKQLKRNHKFLSVFGGPHPTFFPSIIQEEEVDVVCRGEGENAFVDLLDTLDSPGAISNIPNLVVKKGDKITSNPLRPLTDVNGLPFPDRSLVAELKGVGDGPIKHFISSRGCPFNCSYCFNESFSELYKGLGQRVRFRDVSSVVDEIEEVTHNSPTRFVYFQDDTFTLNKTWLTQFADEYSKRISLPFHCHVRPNTLDKEKADLLQKAGCYSVHIAAETANDRLRNKVLNRGMTQDQILNASKLLRDRGIRFMLQNMIGLPSGSLKDDFDTLELNIRCKPDYSWVSIFQPYPGTRLAKFCQDNGFYRGDFNDLGSNFFDSSKLNFTDEYKNQLANLQKLFAVFVEYPELHSLGLSSTMVDAPNTPEVRQQYTKAYQEFRKKADKRLYGFEL